MNYVGQKDSVIWTMKPTSGLVIYTINNQSESLVLNSSQNNKTEKTKKVTLLFNFLKRLNLVLK